MAKKIGVVLSGCGVMDGSEIHESVLTLLAIDRAGAEAVCLAPNIRQRHVVNHLTGEQSKGEVRNVLVESARIARGKIHDVVDVKASDIDALIFPGGFGAAKNLCDYAFNGPNCSVNPEVARLATEVHAAEKPIGMVCIAPVIGAKLFGPDQAQITIGTDKNTAKDIEKMGAKHVACPVSEFVVDKKRKLVSTPAYMLANSIKEAAEGIEKLVRAVIDLA
ncbi:MAG TPA: isoprenoid biosynthesis glyoxalase ElbB [Verrucomicrobiae bacterium]|nr:isoprenoid biosynthesis glyoxalase ElbB [Verrucomicrobiae bacterium]